MKNHLKRIAAPKTWILDRQQNIFTVRPNPGAHSLDTGLPLGMILRDILNYASTMGEVRKILNNKDILVDGKKRKDHRFMVGLFDVLSFPELKKQYRVVLDNQGRLVLVEISAAESTLKPFKVIGKTMLSNGKIQFNLYDGKNIITDKKLKVGDSIVLELPQLAFKEVLPLDSGAIVFLTKGKHGGDVGKLKEIKGKEALYLANGKEIETAKSYLFVVGKKEPVITLYTKMN